jgi:hypothetical protein
MEPFRLMALLCGLSSALVMTPLRAEEEGRFEGRVFTPGSNLERPGDEGRNAHSQHRLLMGPAVGDGPGGTSVRTDSHGNWDAESAWADGGGGNSRYVAKPATLSWDYATGIGTPLGPASF